MLRTWSNLIKYFKFQSIAYSKWQCLLSYLGGLNLRGSYQLLCCENKIPGGCQDQMHLPFISGSCLSTLCTTEGPCMKSGQQLNMDFLTPSFFFFFFGYTGCPLLSSGFLYLWQAWAPLVAVRGLLIVVASLVAEHRLWDTQASVVTAHRLRSCESRAWAQQLWFSCSEACGISLD